MSNIFSDAGGFLGSDFLTNVGNSSLGQKYSDKIVASVTKKVTPSAPVQVSVAAPAATPVNVADDGSMMKKIMIAGGAILALLVGVYFLKKGRK